MYCTEGERARLRRRKKDLRKIDPESAEYWNEVLRREGLSMSAGADTRLTYAGSDQDLQKIEARVVADLSCGNGRRVAPKGAKPE